jgi:hypothetical protein
MNRLAIRRQLAGRYGFWFLDQSRCSTLSRYPRQPCWGKKRIVAPHPEKLPDNFSQIFSQQCLQYLRHLSVADEKIRGKTGIILSGGCEIATLRFNQGRSGNTEISQRCCLKLLHSPYSGQVRKLACPVWAGWLKVKKSKKVQQA